MQMEKGNLFDGHRMPFRLHLLPVPRKYCVSRFTGYLRGKAARRIFEKAGNLKDKIGNRHFLGTGY